MRGRLREQVLKTAEAELDGRLLNLLFHGDYGDLGKMLDKIKERVSVSIEGTRNTS